MATAMPPGAAKSRRKFLKLFPNGFNDETYVAWERGYKWRAHQQWKEFLGKDRFRSLLRQGKFAEIAAHAVRIESRTNLLFSFEKIALRDAVRSRKGAKAFAEGLYAFLHGAGSMRKRFENWCKVIALLPRKQTRVLTWPMVTVFGFIAQPNQHIFLKPMVTKLAAREFGYDFRYQSRPSWDVYASFLSFAGATREHLADLHPRDFIDLQSFLWVLGSDEYD